MAEEIKTNPAIEEEENYYPHAEDQNSTINPDQIINDVDNYQEDFHNIQKFLEKTKETQIIMKVAHYFENSTFDNSAIYAIDGNLFGAILNVKNSDFISNNLKKSLTQFLLGKCAVFARMTPKMKAQLVSLLKQKGYNVLMCGDGANDCAALKVANVGVSLSIEDASIASHFTSLVPNITCVQKIIIEGKVAISITQQVFKTMICYSLINLVSGTILIYHGTYVDINSYIVVEFLLVLPFCCLIPFIPSPNKLCKEIPKRTILNIGNICSVIFNLILTIFFELYVIAYCKAQPWFVPYNPANPNDEYDYSFRPSYEHCVSLIIIKIFILVHIPVCLHVDYYSLSDLFILWPI